MKSFLAASPAASLGVLIYRKLAKNEQIDGNHYGEQGIPVVAIANGIAPRELGPGP